MEEVLTAATLAQFLGYTGMGLAAVHAIRLGARYQTFVQIMG